jgi:quercetin dioxygenase-like cupin family protein
VHRAHDESFFVLTGHVRFVSGSDEHVLSPGSSFVAGMGTPHTFGNADADERGSLLLTVTPQRYVGYFRELQELRPGPDGMLVATEVLALMARYQTEPFSRS